MSYPNNPKECKHEDFSVCANVIKLENTGQWTMDVTVDCMQCGHPFVFLGLPFGVNLNGAATSLDGTEGRFGLCPKGETPKTGGLSGFTVNRLPPKEGNN